MDRNSGKKYKELIMAFIEGMDIQYKNSKGEWVDVINPHFNADNEYRIKMVVPKFGELIEVTNDLDGEYYTRQFLYMYDNKYICLTLGNITRAMIAGTMNKLTDLPVTAWNYAKPANVDTIDKYFSDISFFK